MKILKLIFTLVMMIGSIAHAQEKGIDVNLDFRGYDYLGSDKFYPSFGVAYRNNYRGKVLIRAQFDYANTRAKSGLLQFPGLSDVPTDLERNQQQCYALSILFGYNVLNPESISRLTFSSGVGFRSYRFRYLNQVVATYNQYNSSHRTDTVAAPLPFVPLELRYEVVIDGRIGLNVYGGSRIAISDRNVDLIEENFYNTGTQTKIQTRITDEPYFGFGLTYYFRDIVETSASTNKRKPKGGYYEIWW